MFFEDYFELEEEYLERELDEFMEEYVYDTIIMPEYFSDLDAESRMN